jgi:ADP-heptose:LPS heptosyltransferase
VLTLHSTFRIGLLAWLAQIPLRIAPASKIAQIFYNERVIQRRSRSRQPEHAYNTDLGRHLIRLAGKTDFPEPTPPFLQFPSDEISQLRRAFAEGNRFDAEKPIVFIHAGHGGSANNLSLKQYAALAGQLRSTHGHHVVLTAGPSEESAVRKLSDLLKNTTHTVYVSREGLAQFARHIAFADVFVSGSTGPLHIAGALDVPTAAFYTRRRSATALRWQTLNSESRRLAFSPPDDAEVEDMSRVDIDAAAEKINRTYLADARNAVGGEPGFPPARE